MSLLDSQKSSTPDSQDNKEKVLVIADSILKGIDKHMEAFDVELSCFGGYTPTQLIGEVDRLLPGKKLLSHCSPLWDKLHHRGITQSS